MQALKIYLEALGKSYMNEVFSLVFLVLSKNTKGLTSTAAIQYLICKHITVHPVMSGTVLPRWKCHKNIEISYWKENIFEIPQRKNWNHPAEFSMK